MAFAEIANLVSAMSLHDLVVGKGGYTTTVSTYISRLGLSGLIPLGYVFGTLVCMLDLRTILQIGCML